MDCRVALYVLVAVTLLALLGGRAEAARAAVHVQSGAVRRYYIAAVERDWDYAPFGADLFNGQPFTEERYPWLYKTEETIGQVYTKALYREFTDASFSVEKERGESEIHLGVLGPPIYAEVGDTIEVTFKNLARFNFSMHPHGVFYTHSNEGAKQAGLDIPGSIVRPNDTYVYTWKVPDTAGPGPADPSSIVWLYHSHQHEVIDTNAGLVGPIVITREGEADERGMPKDVDEHLFIMMTVMDENLSPYLVHNILRTIVDVEDGILEDEDFLESNLMHCINGYVFGNQPSLKAALGSNVRWYLMSLGNENDLHVAHWHGNTLLEYGHRTDVAELFPASMRVLDMVPNNPGTWLFHCHTNDHIEGGMTSYYTIE